MSLLSLPFRHPPIHPNRKRVSGFSILEAVTTICLIGIFGSIALGAYTADNRDIMERITNQRNAQEIVSLGVCATMSGAEYVVKGDKQATAINLIMGVTGKQGMWKDREFRLVNLRPIDLPGALIFVKFDGDVMLYDPTGSQP